MILAKSVRNQIFLILLLSSVIGSLVHTALNTALTPIMREFGIPAGTVQWLSSAYSLSMGVMVLATAYLIRRFHGRPLFLIFMVVFCI